MKISRKRILYIVAVLGLVLIAAIPKLRLLRGGSESGGGGARGDSRVPVKAHIVVPERLDDRLLTSGTVLANEEVSLRSEVSGKVVQIFFREGSAVNAGQKLIKINDSELQAQLLREQYRLQLAEEREKRQRQLFEQGLVAQEAYDVALNEFNTVKAGIQLIKAQIEKTEIKAPFQGTIGLKYVSEGSYIEPSTRVASLQDMDPVKVDFSIPEKYVGNVSKGAVIRFRIQGSSKTYTGTVYAVEPRIDQATRTLQLRAMSKNPIGELVPGAFAEIELVMKSIPNALTIPAQALIPEMSGQKIYVTKDGVVESRKVTTGLRTSSTIQITSGAEPGDTVITGGILQVRPGTPVLVTEIN